MSPDQVSGRWSDAPSVLESPPRRSGRIPPDWQIIASFRNPELDSRRSSARPRILVRQPEPIGTPVWFAVFSVTVALLAGLILVTFGVRITILGRDGGVRATPAPVAAAKPAVAAATHATPEPSPTPEPNPTPAQAVVPSTVDTGGANAMLRAGPSLEANIVERLPNGARVTELGQEIADGGRTWRQIQSPSGNSGWIDSSLVRRGTAAPAAGNPSRPL
jgi:hypothetical protein